MLDVRLCFHLGIFTPGSSSSLLITALRYKPTNARIRSESLIMMIINIYDYYDVTGPQTSVFCNPDANIQTLE